jgi:hypothetical protein
LNMPNGKALDKRNTSRIGLSARLQRPTKPQSATQLLQRATLARVMHQAARQAFWRDWLAQRLPTELASRVSGVTERDACLVVFAESSAWSARLRYAVRELEPQILRATPGIDLIKVRVLPRG